MEKLPGQPAPWITNAGVTPSQYFFGFVHTNDPLILYPQETATWTGYGLNPFGGPLQVENSAAPYQGSHEFITGLTPNNYSGPQDYHGATVVDSSTPVNSNGIPVFLPVWQFMMIGPPELPQLQITPAANHQVQIAFGTYTNCGNYQVQATTNLSNGWNNLGNPIPGNGASPGLFLNATNASQFYRVSVSY